MKKVLSVVLACVLLMSAMSIGVFAVPAEVEGIHWLPCATNRQNDLFWEAECISAGCVCQSFLDNETTTGNKNFLDTAYGEDGSLTLTRNGNDGQPFYWPRVRTLLPAPTTQMALDDTTTLYFDFEATTANWNIMLSFSGDVFKTVKLSKVISDAAGVSGVANSDGDGNPGKYAGAVNLKNALAAIAAEGSTESAPYALSLKSLPKVPVPQVSIFCIGGQGVSVKVNKLYIASSNDPEGANCTYGDMALMTDDHGYTDTPDIPGGAEEPSEPVVQEDMLGDLKIAMTANKTKYTAKEPIEVTITALNTNEAEPVENVCLESIIPDGYTLAEGFENALTVALLQPGEQATLTAKFAPVNVTPDEPTTTTTTTATPTDSTTAPSDDVTTTTTVPTTGANSDPATTAAPTTTVTAPGPVVTVTTKAPDVPKDVPKTGDTSQAILALVILAVAAAAMVLCYKTRGGKQMMSVALCLTLGLGMVAAVPVMTDAAEAYETKAVFVTVKVAGEDLVLTGNVSYGMQEAENTPTEATEATTTTAPTTTTTAPSLDYTVTLPQLPTELVNKNSAGAENAKFTVQEIMPSIDTEGKLHLYFTLLKTFDAKGDAYKRSCKIYYKIYDSANTEVNSGTYNSSILAVNESAVFHQWPTGFVGTPGETYTLVISGEKFPEE